MKDRMKEARKARQLTLKQVAEFIHVSESAVSKFEHGVAPSEQTIALFCDKLQINRHWLETGEGDMFLPKPESSLPAELTNDPLIRAILEAYLDLDPQGRQTFQRFFADVVARYNGNQPTSTVDAAVDQARATEPPVGFVRGKRIPVIQGTHEAEIQMQYQAKLEQRELAQAEPLQTDTP